MTILLWLVKMAAKGTVGAVGLALSMLLKLIEQVPPEEYAKLIATLESWLGKLVMKLGPTHPAAEILAGPPPQVLVTPRVTK